MKKGLALSAAALAIALAGAFVVQAQQKSTVTVWMLSDLAPYFKGLADEYQKANPNVTVTVRDYANEAYKTAIQVGLASNNAPDVFFNWAGDDSFKYVRDNQVLDLTTYAKSAGWDKTLSKGAIGAYSQGGKIWGAPISQESKYFFYNKDIFAREGIKVPETLAQLLSSCRSLKAKGITPISFGNSERWPGVHYLTILNQKVVGENQLELDYSLKASADKLFTDPRYVTAFKRLKDMQSAGCFNDAVNSVSPEIAQATFYTGKSAMNFCGTWCLGIMDSNGFKNKYGLFRFPSIAGGRGNQNYVIAGPIGLQISAKSQNKDAAAAFLAYAVSTKAQSNLLSTQKRIPVDSAAITGVSVEPALSGVITDLGKAEGSALWLDTLLESSIAERYLNGIQEVLNGTKTPAQVVAGIREQAVLVKQKLGR